MLKVRIVAATIAILLTLATAYIAPWIIYSYKHWISHLSATQQQFFNLSQVVIGVLIAAYGFWRWKKKKSQPKG